MKLDRVVIGIDFSEESMTAARWTAQHFARGAEIVLVHALHLPEAPRFLLGLVPPRETLIEMAREGAEARLRELSRTLAAQRVEVEIREGRPSEQLGQVATERAADLVVVGKHGGGRGLWQRLGSTPEQLVRSGATPVLMATGVADRAPRKMLLPLDDAPITGWVLEATRMLAGRFDATVTALHVVSAAVLSHVLSVAAVSGREIEPESEEARGEFREETDRWLNAMVGTGFARDRVTSLVAFGEPAQEIVATAAGLRTDLIVMGSRGRGGVRRALLGSVVGEVLRGASCPVLVVVEPRDEIVG